MSNETDIKFQELAKWFYEHERYMFTKDGKLKDNADLAKNQEFCAQAVHNVLYLLTYLYEDIKTLENSRGSKLILPSDIMIRQKRN